MSFVSTYSISISTQSVANLYIFVNVQCFRNYHKIIFFESIRKCFKHWLRYKTNDKLKIQTFEMKIKIDLHWFKNQSTMNFQNRKLRVRKKCCRSYHTIFFLFDAIKFMIFLSLMILKAIKTRQKCRWWIRYSI